jgi:hexosaminidase
MKMKVSPWLFLFAGTIPIPPCPAFEPADLDLVPLPREAAAEPGRFAPGPSRLSFSEDDPLLLEEVREALESAGISIEIEKSSAAGGERRLLLRTGEREPALAERAPEDPDGYSLRISPQGVSIRSASAAGLFFGTRTLKQLLLAPFAGEKGKVSIPCLAIRDWPGLRYRGFSDDITRGPSTSPDYLKREARLASEVKLNFMTYYLEHQFSGTSIRPTWPAMARRPASRCSPTGRGATSDPPRGAPAASG